MSDTIAIETLIRATALAKLAQVDHIDLWQLTLHVQDYCKIPRAISQPILLRLIAEPANPNRPIRTLGEWRGETHTVVLRNESYIDPDLEEADEE